MSCRGISSLRSKSLISVVRSNQKMKNQDTEIEEIKEESYAFGYFFLSGFFSVLCGFFGGMFFYLNVGFSPDTSSGNYAFLLGAVLVTSISFVVRIFNKNRWIFWGLNLFTILVFLLILSSIIRNITET
jgi:hypothetical protein